MIQRRCVAIDVFVFAVTGIDNCMFITVVIGPGPSLLSLGCGTTKRPCIQLIFSLAILNLGSSFDVHRAARWISVIQVHL